MRQCHCQGMGMVIRDTTEKDAAVVADIIRRSFAEVAMHFSLTSENCPTHPSNCTPDGVSGDRAEPISSHYSPVLLYSACECTA